MNFPFSSAVKSKNVVMLSVDKTSVEPGIGIPGSSSTDTRDSLIIGGFNRTIHPKRLRGLETQDFYVGCVRNVFINDEEQKLDASQAIGNVLVSVCPTT
jgi:laminin alpha 3/5